MSMLGITQSGSATVTIKMYADVGASATTEIGIFGPGAVNYWVSWSPCLPLVLSTTGSENRVSLKAYANGHEGLAQIRFVVVAWDA